jgi:hypothetical protein
MMQIPQRAYPVSPYRFLIDRSSAKAHSLFPDRRTLSLGEANLSEETSDAAIVERAAELQAIIVTANGRDFLQAIETHQKKHIRDECQDLYGLIIIPNHYAIQERLVPKLGDKLRFDSAAISWGHVQINNLCVRLTDDGQVKVTALSRCRYCLEFDPKRPMKSK